MLKILMLLSVSIANLAHAANMPLSVTPNRISAPLTAGSITGGKAADSFTLTKITRENAPNGIEKWSLTYGDRMGRPLVAGPGFFHVSIDRNSRRIVIDLAQVHRTAVEPRQLEQLAKASKLVASSDMIMDPQDHSTNITLTMKTAVSVRVASESTGGGKLVLLVAPANK